MDILTNFYIEAYKKGMYEKIAIGHDTDGYNYYLTAKQINALKLLKDKDTLFVGYGGSARCFVGETKVLMSDLSYKDIKDIELGEYVISYDKRTNNFKNQKVIKKYKYCLCSPAKMIKLGGNIISTNEHRFLFRGKWTKAKMLRERAMETNRRQLFHFRLWKIGNYKSSWFWKINAYETCIRWIGIFTNNDKKRRQIYYNKNAQRGIKSFFIKSRKKINSKSQKFHKDGQPFRKSGMDDSIGKCKSCFNKWKAWKFMEKRGKTASKLFKAWFGQWPFKIDRTSCKRNQDEIYPKNLYTENVGRGIWRFAINNKGCYSKTLEAREITGKEILSSKEIYFTGYVYDLEVENTHSYCVSEDNIIVHNSGKTLLECFWITFECLAFPGVAYGLARKELTVLKKTVLRTLFQVFTFYKLKDGEDYKYHEQKNIITFKNGSEIFLIDMAFQPSDPLYTRFGGLELTGAAVDESNESDYDAIGTLFTRCGWRKNTEYGIKKKMLETFNPDHGHVYKRYYAPFRDKLESESRKFIPALPGDNPHPATKEWIEDIIKENDKVRIQRLIYGNFDYSEDESMLVDWDAINEAFSNDNVQKDRINKYISADIALQGRDKFVCGLWYGKHCEIVIDKAKATAPEVESDIKKLMQSHNIYNSNVVGDSDGLGGFLAGYIRNIKAFRGNKKAINHKDYDNIKSECAWKLADLINKREIKIVCTPKQEELIKQELSVCLRRDNVDIDDQKKKLIKKPQMKRELGRSPDYFDAIMMGMIFFLTRGNNSRLKVKKE